MEEGIRVDFQGGRKCRDELPTGSLLQGNYLPLPMQACVQE